MDAAAQAALLRYHAPIPTTLQTAARPPPIAAPPPSLPHAMSQVPRAAAVDSGLSSTVNGVVIGLLSSFGSAVVIGLLFGLIYFLRNTAPGRILLDRIGRPGEYDDEQAFLREEADALEDMDDIQRAEYLRAKAFIQANPPESLPTDISLSQHLVIQEKGVSAWEFEPELEIANCFVEGRTEIEFFDSECSVLSNLPVPKQHDVYYWEAKVYDKPDSSLLSIGMATKPYPLFRLPGYHKHSIAYLSTGQRRHNQPFNAPNYGPQIMQGDVIGVGYRPRTGTVFFTRNGKKLDDVAHGLKTQNLFPAVGANGPCTVHVNFGQSGFVFIEANVKKWGLAPMTGSLAPPPPYGSEQGSILLESGRESGARGSYSASESRHARSSSSYRFSIPQSPGPIRSPTDISLAQLAHIPSNEDAGEGPSTHSEPSDHQTGLTVEPAHPPPEYTSPLPSAPASPRSETAPLRTGSTSPPIPSYTDTLELDRERERAASRASMRDDESISDSEFSS